MIRKAALKALANFEVGYLILIKPLNKLVDRRPIM